MKKLYQVLKTGSRSSNLALLQSRSAAKKLSLLFEDFSFDIVACNSPGDRDKKQELTDSPDNFFTKDLDDKVLSSELDCAIHSAKDLPYPVADGLDWFWLPWNEDQRDVVILKKDTNISDLPKEPIIGVSSERRIEWAKNEFPQSICKSIRGNIEERIEQVDSGKFDIIIMAAAALIRLGLENRISEYIPINRLKPPDGQGYLAVTFRKNDERFKLFRSLFTNAVTFTGAGSGRASLCTKEGIESLNNCDICIYDALIDTDILKEIPESSQKVYVGKRSGEHSIKQDKITEIICNSVRQGKKVVRLKGGDPAIFGRLKEEVSALNALKIPYKIIPGISSLLTATGPNGILLTQRGISNGFTVITPKKENNQKRIISNNEINKLPLVLFMSVEASAYVLQNLIKDGASPTTPATMVFSAGSYDEETVFATVESLTKKLSTVERKGKPGLLIVGDTAGNAFKNISGAMVGKKVLITASKYLSNRSIQAVESFGAKAVQFPLIELVDNKKDIPELKNLKIFDHIILTSPSTIKFFMAKIRSQQIDIRTIPKITVSGSESAKALANYSLLPYFTATGHDASESIVQNFLKLNSKESILKLGSNKRGGNISTKLRDAGYSVKDISICENREVKQDFLPEFDAVLFSSGSGIESFINQFGKEKLDEKTVSLLGTPSETILKKYIKKPNYVMAETHSVESQAFVLAKQFINQKLKELH